ncbi:TraR/DksA family transcriptional regulator [Patescibacteria group bacterium]
MLSKKHRIEAEEALRRELVKLGGMNAKLRSQFAETDDKPMLIGDGGDRAHDFTAEILTGTRLGKNAEKEEEIRAALLRIREGTFGICQMCEEPIPLGRLRATKHTAALCINCASKKH